MRYSWRSLEGGHLRDERARERRTPALLGDCELDAFDAAVGVGVSGADEAPARAEPVDGTAEVFGAELGSVVGGELSLFSAGGGEL
jgi:hypothetical protein